jgi:hypothetical protein
MTNEQLTLPLDHDPPSTPLKLLARWRYNNPCGISKPFGLLPTWAEMEEISDRHLLDALAEIRAEREARERAGLPPGAELNDTAAEYLLDALVKLKAERAATPWKREGEPPKGR